MSYCLTCGRNMVIVRGNFCKTCFDQVSNSRKDKETGEMISDTLGVFSLFEDGVKPIRKFKRRRESIHKRKFKND